MIFQTLLLVTYLAPLYVSFFLIAPDHLFLCVLKKCCEFLHPQISLENRFKKPCVPSPRRVFNPMFGLIGLHRFWFPRSVSSVIGLSCEFD
mgnify:CR=1 FL=1